MLGSYRLAIQETVKYFTEWMPTIDQIDGLKAEGCWNNDWKASQELIKRYQQKIGFTDSIPSFDDVVSVFSRFYFGGDPAGDSRKWKGFIRNEPLLVDQDFFAQLTLQGFQWGFVSGAESPSAKFVLETRLGLKNPPLIAMGDAPDKPDPSGLLQLASEMVGGSLGLDVPPIGYVGDTVADVLTIQQARIQEPKQAFLSLAVAPPHLHSDLNQAKRFEYEKTLSIAGADRILESTIQVLELLSNWDKL